MCVSTFYSVNAGIFYTRKVFALLCSLLFFFFFMFSLFLLQAASSNPSLRPSVPLLIFSHASFHRNATFVLRHGERQEVISSGDVYECLRQCNLLGVFASQILRRSLFIPDFLLVSLHLSGHLSYLRVLSHTRLL